MQRFLFFLGWWLTVIWLHLTDRRIWRFLLPYVIVFFLGFLTAKLLTPVL